MSYFNEAAGGPRRGHEHLLDSNIDWGQDLFLLKRWADRHTEARPLAVAYHGLIDPSSVELVPDRLIFPGRSIDASRRMVRDQCQCPARLFRPLRGTAIRPRLDRGEDVGSSDNSSNSNPGLGSGDSILIYEIEPDNAFRSRPDSMPRP